MLRKYWKAGAFGALLVGGVITHQAWGDVHTYNTASQKVRTGKSGTKMLNKTANHTCGGTSRSYTECENWYNVSGHAEMQINGCTQAQEWTNGTMAGGYGACTSEENDSWAGETDTNRPGGSYRSDSSPLFADEEDTTPKPTAYLLLSGRPNNKTYVNKAKNPRIIVTGKADADNNFSIATGTNGCGSYWNGSSYVASSTYTGTAYMFFGKLLHTGKSDKMPQKMFYVGSQPSPGTHIDGLTFYNEGGSGTDDGDCVYSGRTYWKISGTADN